MNINELITKAHNAAKAKGFWDTERNTGELLMLIVSECGEALEAHRKGRKAGLKRFLQRQEWYLERWTMLAPEQIDKWDAPSIHDKIAFEEHIKDTFEDELADIVIRIADYLGHRGWLDDGIGLPGNVKALFGNNVGRDLLQVTKAVVNETEAGLDIARRMVELIAKHHNIDLWRHIELKMAYNETRERLHGKAY